MSTDKKVNSKEPSLLATLGTILLFIFSLGQILVGIGILLFNLAKPSGYLMEGIIITSLGISVLVSVYNIMLYFQSTKLISMAIEAQLQLMEKQKTDNSTPPGPAGFGNFMESFLGGFPGQIKIRTISEDDMKEFGSMKEFDSMEDFFIDMQKKKNPDAKKIEDMSEEELKAGIKEAVALQEYEKATILKNELNKKKK